MTWFKVDDKFHDHPKARRAGLAACGLWLRAGSWSADQRTDGFVPDDVLARWGGRGVDVYALADTLVEARLWDRVDGADETTSGYQFRKWAKYQPTRAELEAKEAAKSDAGALGNHRRWHEREGRFDPACSHCVSTERSQVRSPDGSPVGSVDGSQSRSRSESPRPVPARPEPVPSSVDARTTPGPVDNPAGLTDDDLDKIARQTNGDRSHATRVAAEVLGRADGDVRRPLAYVLRAVADDPERYRLATRVTKADECPQHAGQLAHACPGCRFESLDPSPVPRTQIAASGGP